MNQKFAAHSGAQSGGDMENPNVSCSVDTCIYHETSDCCSASEITVSNERAQNAQETNCATFSKR